ncbi:T205 protein [Hirschfeldia incana]|nr:T205 protein [Hirschfeldia incana]
MLRSEGLNNGGGVHRRVHRDKTRNKNMSDPSGQSSTTAGGNNNGGGNSGGGSGGSFASQPQRAKVRTQVWAGVLGISTNK